MFIGVLLKNVYGDNLRFWVLHFLNYCVKYHCPLITSADLLKYDLLASEEEKRLFEVNGVENLKGIEIYCITEDFYDSKRGMSTCFSLHLYEERDSVFENELERIINEITIKHSEEEIEGFINFGQGYYSLDWFAKQKKYKVIRSDLSPMRKNDGYRATFCWAVMNDKLYGGKECERRYESFIKEKRKVPVFSRKELIYMFGRPESWKLLDHIDEKGEYEIGICQTKYRIEPQWFAEGKMTDDDLYFLCRNIFDKRQISFRRHPLGYSEYDTNNEQESIEEYIVKNKRICAVASNSIALAMLWNRTVCCKYDILPYAFMAQKDFSSEDVVDIRFLNWLIFGFMIPGYEYLFNDEYWKYRYTNPLESELYLYHIKAFLSKIGIDISICNMDEPERLEYIKNRVGG